MEPAGNAEVETEYGRTKGSNSPVNERHRVHLALRPVYSSTHKFALSRACPLEKDGRDAATETVARFHEKWNTDENSAGFRWQMLRDDSGNEGRRPRAPRNVLGDRLEVCSISPMTGFFRDGCCDTGREDIGSHTVCAVMTAAFLEFSKSRGNDLSTPMPEFGFRGLKPGDR